jgi:hypothetical protein
VLVGLAAAIAFSACAGERHARLDTHGLSLEAPAAAAHAPAAAASRGESAEATSLRGYQLHESLMAELSAREQSLGAAGLETVEPSDATVAKLRFCLSRVMLGRIREVEVALAGILDREQDNVLALRLAADARLQAGDAARAADLYREALAAEEAQGLAPYPDLRYLLGVSCLQSGDAPAGERLLREELARGPNAVRAAGVLVSALQRQGDLEGALAVADAALQREPGQLELTCIRAGLLADMQRPQEALGVLDAAAAAAPHPMLARQRARLLRQSNDIRRAIAALDDVMSQQANHPWVQQWQGELRKEVEFWRGELQRGARVASLTELFGLLRFSPRLDVRVQALTDLRRNGTPDVVAAAAEWGLRDPEPTVRAAVAGTIAGAAAQPLVATALKDDSPIVRGAAARAATHLPKGVGVGLLVDAISREDEPYAFKVMHRELCTATGKDASLPLDGEKAPEVRAAVSRHWRELCGGLGGSSSTGMPPPPVQGQSKEPDR